MNAKPNKRERMGRKQVWLQGVLFLGLCSALYPIQLSAKVPEPDTIFYGTVQHLTDQPLIPGSSSIQVQALVDGVVMATAEIPAGTNTYLVRIPMDDGVAPLISGTAQGGDTVHIRVINLTEGLDFEVNQTEGSGILINVERGTVVAQDLQLDENLQFVDVDMDAMADAWESQYTTDPGNGVAPLSLSLNDAALDNDGDGQSNGNEFIAGTDPLQKASVFRIVNAQLTSGTTYSVTFGPIRSGRHYAIRYKTSLLESSWSPLSTTDAFANSNQVTWDFDISGTTNGMFQASVEMLP